MARKGLAGLFLILPLAAVPALAAVCASASDKGKTQVGLSAPLASDMRGEVEVHILCGEDAAMAAARAATQRKTASSNGQAVLQCAKALQEKLDKEAETGQLGYLPPQLLDEGTSKERYRQLKTGGQYSRRAVEHGRKEEYAEAVADLLRALLRANLDATAWDKLMSTLQDFLKKAGKRREAAAKDGDLADLFDALDMEDDGKDNSDLDRAKLKRNYRELSVKYHPDKNPESAARFNRIRDAYEILSDPVKMVLYDTGGMELVKKYEKDGDAEIQRVDPHESTADISLADAYIGLEKEIYVNRRVVCRGCRLSPNLPRCRRCNRCPGEMQQRQVWMDQYHYRIEEFEVPSEDKCIQDQQKIKIQIEKGVMHGDRMQHPFLGSQTPKKIPGDILATVRIQKHPVFKRLGNDLMVDVHISLMEALLGFKRELVHLDGHIIHFGVERGDAILRPNSGLELEGEGMPLKEDPSSAGKLYIRFQIDFPESLPDGSAGALEAAFKNLPGQGSRPLRVDTSKASRSRSEL
eukprot:TRINITY_DN72186_c0_g1_i1.p1 TRINITY_DN72186_c0_g1~~TRINITY_DN72186_c0_g1_i1.p1  ORF type:complete len:523 (-),score=129.81 TRINITY_DN72186_c0_g1_i1:68-1636(-)